MSFCVTGDIFAFNTQCPSPVQRMAKENGIKIWHSNVIYRLFEGLKKEIEKKLPFTEVEEITGTLNLEYM